MNVIIKLITTTLLTRWSFTQLTPLAFMKTLMILNQTCYRRQVGFKIIYEESGSSWRIKFFRIHWRPDCFKLYNDNRIVFFNLQTFRPLLHKSLSHFLVTSFISLFTISQAIFLILLFFFFPFVFQNVFQYLFYAVWNSMYISSSIYLLE